jgi:sigma-B regulation protein RsbU (phosphoserine phosphatase)
MSDNPEIVYRDTRFLADLIEINHEITAILDLDLLLSKIAEVTERFVSYQVFAILLVDETEQELYYRFAIGHPDDVVDSLRVPIGEGVIGTAAAEKRPVVVDDVLTDPRYINVVKGTRSELAVPLISKSKVLGVLDIESPEVGYFHEDQVRMLHLLGSQIAIAIENANVYESERRNRELLTLLYDISLEIASTLDVDELINKIADAVKSTIDYHIFSIMVLDEQRTTLRPRIVFRLNTPAFEKYDVPMGKGLVGTAALENKAVRVGNVSGDDRYINVHRETVSEMVIPLVSKGLVIGVLDLESRNPDYFTDYHQRLLMTLATRISSALVNAELYEKVVANEKRLDNELEIAREVQRQLLPEVVPAFGALELAMSFIPVEHLGGDLYDLIRFDDGRVAITVGDVSGKGAPAALYGALSSGIIRTLATRKYLPAKMLEIVNRSLQQRPIGTQYIVLVYAVFDPETRQITIANSGLPYPVRIRAGACGFLDLAGIPLGLFPDSKYQEETITLEEGEILVFYTDGIVEMTDEDENEFGLKRLAQLVQDLREKTPTEIVAAIDDEVRQFAGCCPSQDDRTMCVMKMGADHLEGVGR